MTDYYNKYQKYKNKYHNAKNNIMKGGVLFENVGDASDMIIIDLFTGAIYSDYNQLRYHKIDDIGQLNLYKIGIADYGICITSYAETKLLILIKYNPEAIRRDNNITYEERMTGDKLDNYNLHLKTAVLKYMQEKLNKYSNQDNLITKNNDIHSNDPVMYSLNFKNLKTSAVDFPSERYINIIEDIIKNNELGIRADHGNIYFNYRKLQFTINNNVHDFIMIDSEHGVDIIYNYDDIFYMQSTLYSITLNRIKLLPRQSKKKIIKDVLVDTNLKFPEKVALFM